MLQDHSLLLLLYNFVPSVFHCLPMPSEFLDFTKPAPNRPALLFRKCISYKRAVIITCYYYNVSILVTCGFQDRKSSIFLYINVSDWLNFGSTCFGFLRSFIFFSISLTLRFFSNASVASSYCCSLLFAPSKALPCPLLIFPSEIISITLGSSLRRRIELLIADLDFDTRVASSSCFML